MDKKLDKCNIEILSVLAENRKATLNEIVSHCKLKGIKVTGEATRKRLEKLRDILFIPLINNEDLEHKGLEALIVLLKIKGGKNARLDVLKKIKDLGSFFILTALGNFDLIGFFLIPIGKKADEVRKIIDGIKEKADVDAICLYPTEYQFNKENFFIPLGA